MHLKPFFHHNHMIKLLRHLFHARSILSNPIISASESHQTYKSPHQIEEIPCHISTRVTIPFMSMIQDGII
ncbi:hypothetical protein PanWU01x14_083250 [Parasponia andersonii]|uniref:Uncharacterized protein n=1 Tax=Parasponia andersonii TaxID=3476 RepID=A0A2P5DA49_PARAD|nr:hypothetical protein PanWU01x14_083250 [Parasponia andersonii]